ncbi:DeoR/GlpR transcriptional regulator [Phycicoccus sp. BSK3Z-2]|uniref:DeoR/GlpR transcriptional regulator n=2 Tax=Phycicoccus avicenniae TaxID=2828860 RepID=A0A941D5W7_9MICO|nr:DeoR/GlpR transcriptional regulator [Phycicoccus avicenniae]
MTPQQRLAALLDLVSERGTVTVADVERALGVSGATVRRDLTTLAEQGLVTRTHGGATARGSGYELPLQYKAARQASAKVAIADAVACLVRPGDAVGLNGGTTTTEVARRLGRDDALRPADGAPGVTVVTNALNIAYELSVREHVKIVVTGGVPRRQSYELVGPMVTASLQDVALDLAVLGVDGLSGRFGATTVHEGEAQASRDLAAVARRVVVAADATKIGRGTFARILPLSAVDVLVTDRPVDDETAHALEAAEVETVVAPAP